METWFNFVDMDKEFEEWGSQFGSSADEATDDDLSDMDALLLGKKTPRQSPVKPKTPQKEPTPKKKKRSKELRKIIAPPWTYLEDHMLMDAAERYQEKWNAISQALPGRSTEECRARLHELRAKPAELDRPIIQKRKRLPSPSPSETPREVVAPTFVAPPKSKSVVTQTRLNPNVLRIQAPHRSKKFKASEDAISRLLLNQEPMTDVSDVGGSEWESGTDLD